MVTTVAFLALLGLARQLPVDLVVLGLAILPSARPAWTSLRNHLPRLRSLMAPSSQVYANRGAQIRRSRRRELVRRPGRRLATGVTISPVTGSMVAAGAAVGVSAGLPTEPAARAEDAATRDGQRAAHEEQADDEDEADGGREPGALGAGHVDVARRHAAQRVAGAGDGQATVAAGTRARLVGKAARGAGDSLGGLIRRPRLPGSAATRGSRRSTHPPGWCHRLRITGLAGLCRCRPGETAPLRV